MDVTSFHLYEYRVLRRDTYLLKGAFHSRPASEFNEVKAWPSMPPWADSAEDVNTFALVYHAVWNIRIMYPYIVMMVGDVPLGETPAFPGSRTLPQEVFEIHPNVRVESNLGLDHDGEFRRYDKIRVFLFDIAEGDFFEFGGMVTDLSRFRGAFLFSKDRPQLDTVKRLIEQSKEPKELLHTLLSRFYAVFSWLEDTDFILVTTDKNLVKAFLSKSDLPRIE